MKTFLLLTHNYNFIRHLSVSELQIYDHERYYLKIILVTQPSSYDFQA